jgi:glycosyl transferase, family 25
MRSFIIHMAGSTARRPNVDRLLRDLPNAEVVDAVDGRDPAQRAGVQARPGDLHHPSYPFPLSPAEIGVFQSHRRCWRKIVEEGLDHAIIVEDDLAVEQQLFARALDLLKDQPLAQMYVRLPPKNRENPAAVLASDAEMQLMLPRRIGLQTCCQIVGRKAAERLLLASVVIDRPVDTWLQMHWVTGQSVHTILPNGNREIAHELGGSTAQSKTRTGAKPMREIRRAWYRAQVALRPQKP